MVTVIKIYYTRTSRARSALVAVVDAPPGATYETEIAPSLKMGLRRNLGITLFASAKHGFFLSVALLGTQAGTPGPRPGSEPGFFDSALPCACQHCRKKAPKSPIFKRTYD